MEVCLKSCSDPQVCLKQQFLCRDDARMRSFTCFVRDVNLVKFEIFNLQSPVSGSFAKVPDSFVGPVIFDQRVKANGQDFCWQKISLGTPGLEKKTTSTTWAYQMNRGLSLILLHAI